MAYFFIVLFALVILIPLVLGILIPIYKDHAKATNGIVNYDSYMRKFVYKVALTKEEIIHRLSIANDIDELTCSFDFERSVVKVADYGSHIEYFFHIQQCENYSLLRLEQVPLIGMSSHIPYKLNPFLVSKLQAEIIPYSQCGT